MPDRSPVSEFVQSVYPTPVHRDTVRSFLDDLGKQKALEILREKVAPELAVFLKEYSLYGRLITREPGGAYYYNGIEIVMPKISLYYHLFDVVMDRCDSTGFISYATIEYHLLQRSHHIERGYIKAPKKEKLSLCIRQNLLYENQGFFRYATVKGKPIERTLPGKPDQPLFVAVGKGIRVNNPQLPL